MSLGTTDVAGRNTNMAGIIPITHLEQRRGVSGRFHIDACSVRKIVSFPTRIYKSAVLPIRVFVCSRRKNYLQHFRNLQKQMLFWWKEKHSFELTGLNKFKLSREVPETIGRYFSYFLLSGTPSYFRYSTENKVPHSYFRYFQCGKHIHDRLFFRNLM